MEEISDSVKKNLLDLQYNKYLQYHNTCIIILFTYLVGVVIALLTGQINFSDPIQFLFLAILNMVVIAVGMLLMLRFKSHQVNIIDEIKKLKL